MSNYNELLNFFNEADSDEEKDKTEKEDKDDEKKDKEEKSKDEDKKKDDDKKEDDSEPDMDEYNDLMGDDDIDSSSEDDSESESDDDYNDLMGDDDTSSDDADFDDDLGDLNSDDDEDDNKDSGSEYNTLIVMNKSEGGSESGSCYDKAAKVGYAYTVIANNMKHIHLSACGDKFREIHDASEDFYRHFNYAADSYFEIALQSPLTKLDNPTRAKEHCEDIPVEQCSDYEFELAMQTMSSNLQLAITYIEELRKEANGRTDIQSRADEELAYLRKHKDFIIRKSCHKSVPCTPADVAMESYNWLF